MKEQARPLSLMFPDRGPHLNEQRLHALAAALVRINDSFSLSQPITTTLKLITDSAREIIGAHRAVTSMTIDENFTQSIQALALSDKYIQGPRRDEEPDDTVVAALVCRNNRPIRLTHAQVESHPAFRDFGEAAGRHQPRPGCLAVPLIGSDGKNLGALQLQDKDAGDFTAEDEAIAVELAHMAAVAVENASLYKKLRETDRRKDAFLAMLGHELRNPLDIIGKIIDLMRRTGPAATRERELQEMLHRQVKHMARLVDDLLDVSRIERGEIHLKKEQCDFAAIVRETLEDQRAAFEESGVHLTLEVLDEPLWMMADATRLMQVVDNLLCNANKFTESGGTVQVRLQKTRAGPEAAELDVRDTGIGMDMEILAHIFEPFRHAEQSIHRRQGGLGLGLALVKTLVELHGGSVRASSEGPGRGSEIAISLPLPQASSESSLRIDPGNQNIRPCRILIVEDNRMAALTMQMLLRQAGHEVEVAHTGPAGIKMARQFRPQAVLCDLALPQLDGYAVARALRQEMTPIELRLIAISGFGRDEDQQRAIEAGFDIYLVKPLDVDVLEHILKELDRDSQKIAS